MNYRSKCHAKKHNHDSLMGSGRESLFRSYPSRQVPDMAAYVKSND